LLGTGIRFMAFSLGEASDSRLHRRCDSVGNQAYLKQGPGTHSFEIRV
jgi:hypothetical protein